MNGNRILLIVWTVLAISICFPTTTFAASRFNVQPRISTSWEVDSNFYRAESREREVYTYTVSPGLKAEFKSAKTNLMLDYALNAIYYEDKDTVPPNEKPADDENYIGHTFTGEARYQAFDRLLVGLNGSYYLTRDPAQSDTLSNSIERDKYSITRITPILLYEFGPKFTAGLRYRNTKLDYSPENREDSNENRGIFDLVYHFTTKTSVDLEYQYWQKDYDQNTSDYTSNQAKLIFRRQFRILNLEVGAGYQKRAFDDPGLDDESAFTYNLNFGGEQTIANRRTRVSFGVEQNLNDQAEGNNYFRATRFVLNAGHEFTRKVLGEVGAYYQISDYQNTYGLSSEGAIEKRYDKTYDIYGKINYKFARWLVFSVTGGFEKRDSNIAGLSYNDTYFIANLGFAYDLGRK
jgi:hypothetical protein